MGLKHASEEWEDVAGTFGTHAKNDFVAAARRSNKVELGKLHSLTNLLILHFELVN